jgi:hypothetical protein
MKKKIVSPKDQKIDAKPAIRPSQTADFSLAGPSFQ